MKFLVRLLSLIPYLHIYEVLLQYPQKFEKQIDDLVELCEVPELFKAKLLPKFIELIMFNILTLHLQLF